MILFLGGKVFEGIFNDDKIVNEDGKEEKLPEIYTSLQIQS